MGRDTTLFGAGYFGRVHANDLNMLGRLNGIVDTDPSKREIADKYGVPFSSVDLTRCAPGEVPEFVREAEYIDIATNTPSHYLLVKYGIESEKKGVFVEKPPTETYQELSQLLERIKKHGNATIVGVNYIEMAHPVVLAIGEQVKPEEIVGHYHHRAKDLRGVKSRGIGGGEGSRIVLEDLVHDLSQIMILRKRGDYDGLSDAVVTRADMQTWRELDPAYPYGTDVRSSFYLKFGDGSTAHVKGGFADPEVRQFVVSTGRDEAFYGNTLSRPTMSPAAALVTGERHVRDAIESVMGGKILTNEDQEEFFRRTGAQVLEEEVYKWVPECKYKEGVPMVGWAPLYNMLENFFGAREPEDLYCSLRDAGRIQRVAEEVYNVAGKPGSMKPW